MTKPATTAALDQLNAAVDEMDSYINGLDLPVLMAELRCATANLIEALAEGRGPGAPETQLANAIGLGLSRFDLDGGTYVDGNDHETEKTSDRFVALPVAVELPDTHGCDEPGGGILRRVAAIHDLVHTLMHTEED